MKKIILMFFLATLLGSTAQAEGQFGLTGTLNDGAGISYVNDNYTATVLYKNIQNRAGVDEDESNIELNVKYSSSQIRKYLAI